MSNDTDYDLRQMRAERAAAERQSDIEEQAKELADQISRFVNDMSGGRDKAKALGRAMLNDHRTLLQTKMLMVLAYLDGLAEDHADNRYDARNEASCKIAAAVEAIRGDREWIPYV